MQPVCTLGTSDRSGASCASKKPSTSNMLGNRRAYARSEQPTPWSKLLQPRASRRTEGPRIAKSIDLAPEPSRLSGLTILTRVV